MRRALWALVALWVCAAAPAWGADARGSVPRSDYLQLTAGIYSPQGKTLSGDDGNNGWNLDLSYGHYFYDKFTNNFGVEFGLGYYMIDSSSTVPDTAGNVYVFDTSLQAFSGVVSLKWERELFGRVDVYAAAGGGVFVSLLEVSRSVLLSGAILPLPSVSESATDFQPGAQVKAGLQWSFDNGWNLGLEGKYLSSKAVMKSNVVTPMPVEISLDGYTVNGQVSYVW